MPPTEAFQVGRDQYVITALSYQGILDIPAQMLRFQVAAVDSQVWNDWLTVDAAGMVSIPSLVPGAVPWGSLVGVPTILVSLAALPNASGVLTNDGIGGLSWTVVGSGTVTGTGTPGTIPKWDGTGAGLVDSILSESGGDVTMSGGGTFTAPRIDSLGEVQVLGGGGGGRISIADEATLFGLADGMRLRLAGSNPGFNQILNIYASGPGTPDLAGVSIYYKDESGPTYLAALSIRNVASGFSTLNLMPDGGLTKLGGGLTAGSGVVGIIDTTGKIPAISSTYFASLSGANLTGIPNSATTAVSTNTASTIVLRDGSGNFAAGTISAALSGNASTATLAAAAIVLATPRAINGVNFDGSAAITVTAAAGTLTGTTLNATVVTTSITSTGALNAGSITSGFGAIDVGADTISAGGFIASGVAALTTAAEAWVGPSTTAGWYFKGGNAAGFGTVTPNFAGFGAGSRVVTVYGPTAAAGFELASGRADGTNAFVGQFLAWYDTNNATFKTIGEMLFASEGATANKRGGAIIFRTQTDNVAGVVERLRINNLGSSVFAFPLTLKGYTVATLPAGVVGYLAYATDLLAPAFFAVAVGGGAITGPVFYDGANWKAV